MKAQALDFLIQAYQEAGNPEVKSGIATGIGQLKTISALHFLTEEFKKTGNPIVKSSIAIAIGNCAS